VREILISAVSSTTGNRLLYAVDVHKIGSYPCRGMDLGVLARWYGRHVATHYKVPAQWRGHWENPKGKAIPEPKGFLLGDGLEQDDPEVLKLIRGEV
jgi:hypothetical protein